MRRAPNAEVGKLAQDYFGRLQLAATAANGWKQLWLLVTREMHRSAVEELERATSGSAKEYWHRVKLDKVTDGDARSWKAGSLPGKLEKRAALVTVVTGLLAPVDNDPPFATLVESLAQARRPKPSADALAEPPVRRSTEAASSIEPPLAGEVRASLGDRFVGRADELQLIDAVFGRDDARAAAPAVVSIEGGAGLGKSQLAAEYVHRFGKGYPGGCFWVSAASRDQVDEQLHAILAALDPASPSLAEFRQGQRDLASALGDALRRSGSKRRILYVVDNVPEAESGTASPDPSTWCPAIESVALLITSRAHLSDRLGVSSIRLAPLQIGAAVRLLTDRHSHRTRLTDAEWETISEWVGHLPLALAVLNGALRKGLSPEQLLRRAASTDPLRLLDAAASALQPILPAGAVAGVTEAFAISYDRLSTAAQTAARLLACLAPAPIPTELAEALGPSFDLTATMELYDRSILSDSLDVGPVPTIGSVHRIMGAFLRTQTSDELDELTQLCRALASVMQVNSCRDPEQWPLMNACATHAAAVLDRLSKHRLSGDALRDLVALRHGVGVLVQWQGRLREAVKTHRVALASATAELDDDDPLILAIRIDLALALRDLGELQDAEKECLHVLELREALLGRDDPATLGTRRTLASIIWRDRRRDRWEEAEKHIRIVLLGREARLGSADPKTLDALHSLGYILENQQRYEKALDVYSELLERLRAKYDVEAPSSWDSSYSSSSIQLMLQTRHSVAYIWERLKHFDEAEREYRAVIRAQCEHLGVDAFDTLATRDNLARFLQARDQPREAIAEYREVVEGQRRTLGDDHRRTLSTRHALAYALQLVGEQAPAEQEYRAVVAAQLRNLPEDAPDTLATRANLGRLLEAQDRWDEAADEHRAVVDGRQRTLGDDHEETLSARHALAYSLQRAGEFGAAERQYRKVIAGQRRRVGDGHPATLAARQSLAALLQGQWRLADAEAEFRAAYLASRRELGDGDPATEAARRALEWLQKAFLWAPGATNVDVVVNGVAQPMAQLDSGWFVAPGGARPGQDYGFSVDGGRVLPDPRSKWQPNGVHGLSRAYDHDAFDWSVDEWTNHPLSHSVLYELHVGTFTDEGTFAAAIDRLDDLVDLGITTIQLMPVAHFAGNRGWGYDGVALFAVHAAYGGPDELKKFVDACHARNLSVVLDVVYNHIGPEGNYLTEYGPYLSDTHTTPYGPSFNLDGLCCGQVRQFLLDNASAWIRAFRLDGLRIDSVEKVHDSSETHFLTELATSVVALEEELDRPIVLIGETRRPRDALISRSSGGHGLQAATSDVFHNALHAYITGERNGYFSSYGHLGQVAAAIKHGVAPLGSGATRQEHDASMFDDRLVSYCQNHDQVGNRGDGARLSSLTSEKRFRIAAGLLLLGPHVPHLFQGEEWAATSPFHFFTDFSDSDVIGRMYAGRVEHQRTLGWTTSQTHPQSESAFMSSRLDWTERNEHEATLEWYRRLIHLRRKGLGDAPRFSTIDCWYDSDWPWLAFRSGARLVFANFAEQSFFLSCPGNGVEVLAVSVGEAVCASSSVELPGSSLTVLSCDPKSLTDAMSGQGLKV